MILAFVLALHTQAVAVERFAAEVARFAPRIVIPYHPCLIAFRLFAVAEHPPAGGKVKKARLPSQIFADPTPFRGIDV